MALPRGLLRAWVRLRRWRRFALVTLIAAVAAIAFGADGLLQGFDDFYYDAWHQIAGKRRDARHVVIVSVDDATFIKLKDDPLAFWQPHFAQAMRVIDHAGAAVTGLDFVYATSAESWLSRLKLPDTEISRTYDKPFREALAAGRKVLVGHLIESSDGKVDLVLPPPEHYFLLPHQLRDVGLANLYPDHDSIVRHFFPVLIMQEGVPGLGFSTNMALYAAGLDTEAKSWTIGGREIAHELQSRTIGYVGPTGTIPRISMARLLEPGAENLPEVKALKGKVVIITAHDSSSLQDTHLTPYSHGLPGYEPTQMTGGEVHANIVETLLSGRYPRDVPRLLGWALILGLAAAAATLFQRSHPVRGAAFGLALALLAAWISYFTFKADWVLPTASLQFAVLLAYLFTLGLRLTGEERERARLRSMFGSYVSDEVVDLLIAKRGEGEKVDLQGEEMEVTVLFSDIRNFTTISQKLSPHEVVEMLNEYFGRVCAPVLRERGNVNKFIGDAVMAMFGSPVPYPDHARRAIRAALGMIEAAAEFRAWMKARFPDRGLPEFAIGVGVHTGPVISGDIGTNRRREYTIIGDTVNTASRLEGMTKELGWKIVASRHTAELAGPGVIAGGGNSIMVKGRSGEIDVVEILGVQEPI
ncbi:MAG TPA: adenylate/guanylate cyclase domain-containing protein [Burkholderiales bacterium]|jgi:adenylate cyclase